jgi:quercetin dioxygenase-like cupin family protein
MAGRSLALQRFIDAVRLAVLERRNLPQPAAAAAQNIFAALETRAVEEAPPAPQRLPACSYIPAACANARRGPPAASQLADTFAAIEPQLRWRRKPSDDAYFGERHGNAVVVGPDGVERRHDAAIGVSLLAPDTRYPDHNHPPEEIYVVLSKGAWRQDDGPWQEPGLGGLVYNPSNITHAMRSYDAPLLAVWSLWLGG